METDKRPARGDEIALVKAAEEAAKRARCPYSKFPVGAAIELTDGTVIQGFNIESPAFGCCMCGERSAIYTAVVTRDIHPGDARRIAVWGKDEGVISPCGSCRQVMADILGLSCEVLLCSGDDQVVSTTVEGLIPYAFTLEA